MRSKASLDFNLFAIARIDAKQVAPYRYGCDPFGDASLTIQGVVITDLFLFVAILVGLVMNTAELPADSNKGRASCWTICCIAPRCLEVALLRSCNFSRWCRVMLIGMIAC